MPATLVAQPNSASSLTTYTFSLVAFGVANEGRYIICGISASALSGAAFAISSATIGGVTATVIIEREDAVDFQNTHIILALVPTGTTGDIVITFAGAHDSCYVGVYRVTGLLSATPHATASDSADPVSTTINIPAGGLLIGCFQAGNGALSTTTGLAELYDLSFGGGASAGGMSQDLAVQTGWTVGFDGQGDCSGCFASWGLGTGIVFTDFSSFPKHRLRH